MNQALDMDQKVLKEYTELGIQV